MLPIIFQVIKRWKNQHVFPSPHPNIEIIKRYKELGGKIITIGSDAHNSDDLSKDFDLVYDILRSLNIKEIAVFHTDYLILLVLNNYYIR